LSIDLYQRFEEAFVPLRGDFDSVRISGSAEGYCSASSRFRSSTTLIAEVTELAAILVLDAGFTLMVAERRNLTPLSMVDRFVRRAPPISYSDEDTMTSLAKLLTQKQQLLGRLEENPGPNERAELERLLEKVDAGLSSLESAPSDMIEDHDSRSSPRR
jgi:hypothetical protein